MNIFHRDIGNGRKIAVIHGCWGSGRSKIAFVASSVV